MNPTTLPPAIAPADEPRNLVIKDLVFPLLDEQTQGNFTKRFWRGGYDIDRNGKYYVTYHDKPERYKNGVAHVAEVISRLNFFLPLAPEGNHLPGPTANWLRQAAVIEVYDLDGRLVEAPIRLVDEKGEAGLESGFIEAPAGVQLSHLKLRFAMVGEEVTYKDGDKEGTEVVLYFRRGEFGTLGDTSDPGDDRVPEVPGDRTASA